MQRFVVEIIVFTVISTFCLSVFGQNWQDEEHVWNEDKGRFEVHNKAHGRVVDNGPPQKEVGEGARFAPPTEEWARFLPRTVRYGKREATSWEISEAQRKLWVKHVMAQRSAAKAAQRRQLIAYRKATGWYASRRAGGNSHGWMMQMHMNSVNRYVGGGYNGYY